MPGVLAMSPFESELGIRGPTASAPGHRPRCSPRVRKGPSTGKLGALMRLREREPTSWRSMPSGRTLMIAVWICWLVAGTAVTVVNWPLRTPDACRMYRLSQEDFGAPDPPPRDFEARVFRNLERQCDRADAWRPVEWATIAVTWTAFPGGMLVARLRARGATGPTPDP